MSDVVLFAGVVLGAAVGVFAWLAAWRFPVFGGDDDGELEQLERLTRLKLVLVAVLGMVVVGLVYVVNEVSRDVHSLLGR